jgi:hypothetical protein
MEVAHSSPHLILGSRRGSSNLICTESSLDLHGKQIYTERGRNISNSFGSMK